MGFESARRFEEDDFNESIEAPMSRELLRLKNEIQIDLIRASITQGEDIETYPQKWIDQYSDKFHQTFVEAVKEDPKILEDWQDENKHEDVVAEFKRRLYLSLN